MDRRRFWLIAVLLVAFPFMIMAQPLPPDDHEDDGFNMPSRPPRRMMRPEPLRRMKRPEMPKAEMLKLRDRKNALQAVAEGHKELAAVYEEQKKIDEAAAELKKIIELFDQLKADDTLDKEQTKPMLRKTIPVYHEISRLYLQNNRLDDAEKILLEGIEKFEKEEPQSASRLMLQLSNIYKTNHKLNKAEELLKKMIELNKPLINE